MTRAPQGAPRVPQGAIMSERVFLNFIIFTSSKNYRNVTNNDRVQKLTEKIGATDKELDRIIR